MVKHRMATLAFISWLGFLSAFGQAKHITMSFKNENLSSALKRLEKVSGCKIMFTYDDVEGYKVSGSVKDEDFGGVIQMLLSGKPLEYSHEGNLVNVTLRDPQRSYDNEKRELRGTVISSEDNMPVIGATVRIMGTKEAVVTDPDGKFVFKKWPHGARLVISYIGMTSKNVRATENMRIVLSPDSKQMEEVVVNGTFTRKANTFTGAITSVKGEELQKVGNNNVLQSLKNIDPSFMQIENLGAGSNPNALPDFQMRGASTISSVQGEYASSANQPLFILDGFETELTKILDLDMNQVESITSLKDATAKAIYGSKAANGVIVIETKRPDQGKMRVTYTGSLDVEVPDLSSYDLCNASEKLQVEKMAGLFSSDNALSQITLDKAYANKLRDVLAGVNTDWLAQPVRTGVGHKHSLYLEGGQKDLQYGLNLAYNNIEGAMKGSNRNTFSGGITLSYRLNNLVFRNKLSVDYNSSNNSPYGSFSSYYSMITNVTVPYSTGFSTYVANLGETENKGIELYLNYRVFSANQGIDYINVFGNLAHNKNKLKKISNSLRAWNDTQDKNMMTNKTTTPAVKYYEGCSMTAIWAVPSLGIDPQNGKEIFVKKDGSVTYDYDTADQVVCGDTQPKYNGNFGVNGEINGWGFNVTASYRWGGQIYNSTLVDKVENASLQYNVDRRVFTDRWQKPGDVALYKSIKDQSITYPTSRFVEDYSLFSLASLTLYYDFRNCRFVKNSFLERLKISAYTNDLFIISSVKTERGTDYPFARTFSLSAQLTF